MATDMQQWVDVPGEPDLETCVEAPGRGFLEENIGFLTDEVLLRVRSKDQSRDVALRIPTEDLLVEGDAVLAAKRAEAVARLRRERAA